MYVQPLSHIACIIAVLVLFWSLLGFYANRYDTTRRLWIGFNICVLTISSIVILYLTILNRLDMESMKGIERLSLQRELILVPFHSFQKARTQPEIYRSMLMNIYLFVPWGLSFPLTLSGKLYSKACAVLTVIVALLFSISVEALQYYMGIGQSEVDDVLMNSLGCLIGAMSIIIANCINNWWKAKRNED